MNNLNKIIKSFQKQPNFTKAYLYFTVFCLLLSLSTLITIPFIISQNPAIQNQLITKSYAAGSDLYVSTTGSDTDPGTQPEPFKTIQKAANVVSAGTTVHVAPGTYAEHIRVISDGAASARIRFVSDTKWGAKVVPPPGFTGDILWEVHSSYIDVDGFDVSSASFNSTAALIFIGGSYIHVYNNHLHHMPNIPCTPGGAVTSVTNYSGHHSEVVGNTIHHIGDYTGVDFDPNYITSCWLTHGIYAQQDNELIANNILYRNQGFAMTNSKATTRTIVNNTIFSNYGGGIHIDTHNLTIANNIIYDNHKYGIAEMGCAANGGCTNNLYTNNLICGNDINVQLDGGPSPVNTGTADPQFVNYLADGGGDYHLKSTSPAIDMASATYAPATDFDGIPRPQGAGFDIGAYEYVQPAPTPTPTPSSSCQNTFPSNSTPPTGYAASWNPLAANKELLLQATSCSGGNASVTVGSSVPSLYTHSKAYYYTGSSWQQFTLSGILAPGSTDWIIGTGTGSIPNSQTPTFYVGYTCQWTGSAWKCGCTDSACSAPKWQLQGVQ